SYSHTTNLSQLYQLLDSYHSGTNRAVFFLNARPHIVDSPFTFVNGPRRLEGVQEFFLVVRRPKEMENFCVKAVLETAHLHESDVTITSGSTVYDRQQVTQSFSLHADGGSFSADDTPGAFTLQVPSGYILDRTRGGGPFSIKWGSGHVDNGTNPDGVSWGLDGNTEEGHEAQAIPTFTVFDDHVDFTVHIYGIQNVFDPEDANMTWTVTLYTRSIDPIATPITTVEHHVDLFITAREVEGCTQITIEPPVSPPSFAPSPRAPAAVINDIPYVAYEKALGAATQAQVVAAKGTGKDAAIAANAVGRVVKDEVITSFRRGRRYVPGSIDFVHTAFAVRDLLNGVTEPPIPEVRTAKASLPDTVSPALRAKVQSSAAPMTTHQIMRTSTEDLVQHAGLSIREARELKLNAAGIAIRGSSFEPKQAPPRRAGKSARATSVDSGPKSGTSTGERKG
ncbi:MAG TPA: hypothetical protein VIV60_19500, partial [Polyangiaceae bacterium]